MIRKTVSVFALIVFLPVALYATGLININTADKAALMTLNGIGEVKAQAIIDYRAQHGPFAAIQDIQNVSGIGPATYANIKDYITVSEQQAAPQSAQDASSSAPTNAPSYLSAHTDQNGTAAPSLQSNITASAGANRTVITGADTLYEGRAFAKDGMQVGPQGVRFLWNFGDGAMAERASILHHFSHPGRYAVVLDVTSGTDYATTMIIVTVEDAVLGVSYLMDGSAMIENKAGRDLDLSYWTIRQGGVHFSLPQNTIVLTGERIIVPPATLGFKVSAGWELLYPNGDVEGTAPPPAPVIIHEAAKSAQKIAVLAPKKTATVPPAPAMAVATAAPTLSAQAVAVSGSDLNDWTLGAIAAVFLGAGGAYFLLPRILRRGWTIIEEKQ